MSAAAVVEMLGEPQFSEILGWHQGVKVSCSECDYAAFTGGKVDRDWSLILTEHLKQHEAGRALDISVEYTISAWCSVCDDGGRISDVDGETLKCADCDTTWHIDGTGGETTGEEQR